MSAILFLSAVATIAEGAIFWSAAAGYISLLLALALHILLSGVVAFNVFTFRSERAAVFLLAAGVLFMGPFGAVGGVVMGLFALLPGAEDFESHRRTLGPGGEEQNFAHTLPIAGSGRSLIAFQDVMRWGTRTEKQTALRRIAERYSPAFASALKVAMQDEAPEIRSEAAAALNTIVGELETDARALAEKSTKAPGDEERARILARYGDAEMLIAQSDLVTPQRAQDARKSALNAFAEARRHLPDAPELHLKSARAFFEEGALADAARESGEAMAEASHGLVQGEEALTTHLESLFALGRYRDVRHLLENVTASGRMKRAAALWQRSRAVAKSPPRLAGHA